MSSSEPWLVVPSRRLLLGSAVGSAVASAAAAAGPGAAAAHVDRRPSAASPRLRRDPFTLGVASGDPTPRGFVLWTRLAPEPLAADGRGGMPRRRFEVRWEVATDRRFRRVVRRGRVTARPAEGHSVHVEVGGLPPGREFYYRFRLDGHRSRVGTTRTVPAYGGPVGHAQQPLHLVAASCANYPVGHFTAYRRMAQERPDLVLHLGDYLYEYGSRRSPVGRRHVGRELTTLADYRRRHAQYKTDRDLQLAHAVAPWVAVWDDHEVDNDYEGLTPEQDRDAGGFRQRRAAAYRAYWENMPLRRSAQPEGPDLRLFRRVRWGSLATLHLLDTRQYRTPAPCTGSLDCPANDDPSHTLLGRQQERWLDRGLDGAPARWDLLAQQVFFGRRDADPDASRAGAGAWDGYPAARDRLTRSWTDAGVRNPVVLSGDVHAHWAGDIYADQRDPDSGTVGSELVTSSVTSGGDGYDPRDGRHPYFDANPNLRFWTNLRGYVSATLTTDSLSARFRVVPTVRERGARATTRSEWVIEDRVRGLQRVADNPLARSVDGAAAARAVPPDREQIIADTIEQETGFRP